jgi:hypothetical protein
MARPAGPPAAQDLPPFHPMVQGGVRWRTMGLILHLAEGTARLSGGSRHRAGPHAPPPSFPQVERGAEAAWQATQGSGRGQHRVDGRGQRAGPRSAQPAPCPDRGMQRPDAADDGADDTADDAAARRLGGWLRPGSGRDPRPLRRKRCPATHRRGLPLSVLSLRGGRACDHPSTRPSARAGREGGQRGPHEGRLQGHSTAQPAPRPDRGMQRPDEAALRMARRMARRGRRPSSCIRRRSG